MVQEGLKLFALYDKLQELLDEGFDIIPSHLMIVKSKELNRIVDSFPDAIDEGIKMAKMILRNKEEMIQDAKNKAARIIQECENIKMKAVGEAESIRLASSEEALKMKDGAQAYAQQILVKIEQDLNNLFQFVKNGQQYIAQMRNENDELEHQYMRNEISKK